MPVKKCGLAQTLLVGDRLRICGLVMTRTALPGEILGHRRLDQHRHVMRPVVVGADRPTDSIVHGLLRRRKEFEAGATARRLVVLTDCVIEAAGCPDDRQCAVFERIDLG